MSDPLPPEPPASVPPLPPAPAPVPPPAPGGSSSERQWCIAIHLSALLGVFGCSTPGINVLGPLVLWLIKRPESAALDATGKRVLNFQISFSIYFALLWISFFALSFVVVGFLALPALGVLAILWLVFTVIGAVKESNGEVYVFPMTIQFLK